MTIEKTVNPAQFKYRPLLSWVILICLLSAFAYLIDDCLQRPYATKFAAYENCGFLVLIGGTMIAFAFWGLYRDYQRVSVCPSGISLVWRRRTIKSISFDNVKEVRESWDRGMRVRTVVGNDGTAVRFDDRIQGFEELISILKIEIPEFEAKRKGRRSNASSPRPGI